MLGVKITAENSRSNGSVVTLLAISTLFVLLSFVQFDRNYRSAKAGRRLIVSERTSDHARDNLPGVLCVANFVLVRSMVLPMSGEMNIRGADLGSLWS